MSLTEKVKGRLMGALVALVVILSAGGCTVFPERGAEPEQWRLVAPDLAVEPSGDVEPLIVRLVETRAANSIDRRDMAYSRDRQSLAYYRDNRWTSRPAVMLDEIVDETLSTRPWVRTVVRGGARVPADLSLYCEIQRLEHRVGGETGEGPRGEVQMKVACSWYRAAERQLVETMIFDETVTLKTDDARNYAGGAQALVDELMARLAAQGATLAEAEHEANVEGD